MSREVLAHGISPEVIGSAGDIQRSRRDAGQQLVLINQQVGFIAGKARRISAQPSQHDLSTSGYIPLAPTGQGIPTQGETLGIGIRNRVRSEGTPHSAYAGR
jgi:hypothetical protein